MIAFVRTLTVVVSLSVASGAFAQPAAPATPQKEASAWGAAAAAHRRLHAAVLGRRERQAVSSRSRASIRSSCIRSRSRQASARIRSASTAASSARRRSSGSSAWDRRCCWSSPTTRSVPSTRRTPSSARWPTRSRPRCSGGSRSSPKTAARVVVDATAFFLRDAHGVADRLKATGQGSFRLDESRSAIFLPRTKGFPKNTEVEATLTFQGDAPGPLVRQTTPTPSGADRARAPLVRGAAAAGLPASQLRPARGVLSARPPTTTRRRSRRRSSAG